MEAASCRRTTECVGRRSASARADLRRLPAASLTLAVGRPSGAVVPMPGSRAYRAAGHFGHFGQSGVPGNRTFFHTYGAHIFLYTL